MGTLLLDEISDMPLAAQLADRDWRKLFADQMAEGLAALKAANIKPVSSTPMRCHRPNSVGRALAMLSTLASMT